MTDTKHDLPKIDRNQMRSRAVMAEFERDVIAACHQHGLGASEYRTALTSLLWRIANRTYKPRDREATDA